MMMMIFRVAKLDWFSNLRPPDLHIFPTRFLAVEVRWQALPRARANLAEVDGGWMEMESVLEESIILKENT